MPGILIIAEHLDGVVRDITREMIGAARSIKESYGGPIVIGVLSSNPDALTPSVNLEGVDQIVRVKLAGDYFDPQVYEEAAIELGKKLKPGLILFGHTVNGMGCASAVAARLGAGFASDVLGLTVEKGDIVATRGAYGNKLNLEVCFPNKGIVVLTLRGATFPAPAGAGTAAISDETLDVTNAAQSMKHLGYLEAPPSDIDISKAEFILSVGRGIQEKEDLPRFESLAEKMGFTFGCSRPIVDAGWLPKAHQVGQSGKVASTCKVYIALGISGAVQHLFGMKHVDTIIAVNTDPEAPIFNVATHGICMDLFELTKELEAQFNT
jgi:electron transfer flavoprotein alpha subunit